MSPRICGIHPETLRKRVRQAEADSGIRTDLLTTQEREEIRRLRRENIELRRANEDLKSVSVFFAKELDLMLQVWRASHERAETLVLD